MGCEGSRSYPRNSPEWGIAKIRKRYGFSKLSVSEISLAIPRVKSTFLTQLAVNEFAHKLKIRLPNELIRESLRDLRVNLQRLFFTLLILAEDDGAAKAHALKQAFAFTPRLTMACLEWRAELLTARLVERAAAEGLVSLQAAKNFTVERTAKDAATAVAVYGKLDLRDVPGSLLRLSQLEVRL